jgi:hypothetical protein
MPYSVVDALRARKDAFDLQTLSILQHAVN